MTVSVDLNSDMGEGFGIYQMGLDEHIMPYIDMANLACGFHAGDADTMARTMRLAVENRVGIGAHPGFLDLNGFGRRKMDVPFSTLAKQIKYQIGAAQAIARAAGGRPAGAATVGGTLAMSAC